MPTVSCPSCGRALEVDGAYRDWTVRCPHCATEFVPGEASPGAFADDARDADPDDYDRPRRRRRGPDPERDEWERAEAVYLAHGPGTWLEVSGWLGGLLLVLTGAGRIALGAFQVNNGIGPPGDGETQIAVGALSGLLALPYALVMVIGGRKLRALSSYGWAMTASVTGIASFFLLCCVCVCAFFPVGFGIWGLVTLNNPIVRRQLDRARDEASPPREWDD